VRFERAHFARYGDFALIYEVVYWVLSPDYTIYMDTQQRINFAIYRQLQDEQVEFAYPSQTIYLGSPVQTVTSAA
jgi:MscS family membrane protein